MRSTGIAAATLGSAVALVGFSGGANASATIDLIWADTGTNEISDVNLSSQITLQVILTAGPNGSSGGAVSVDYSDVLGSLQVIGYMSTPGGTLYVEFEQLTDTGTRIETISSWWPGVPWVGSGLFPGQSHQLGTVTFHKIVPLHSGRRLEIRSDANGPFDFFSDINANEITATTTFNSAYLIDGDPCVCDFVIDINALRGGSPTVTVGSTKDITAKARIAKGSAPPDTTVNTTLRIDAIDGSEVIDSQSSGPIQLSVGKGGDGDKLTMNINQCNSGSIFFEARFSVPDAVCSYCDRVRSITKTCK